VIGPYKRATARGLLLTLVLGLGGAVVLSGSSARAIRPATAPYEIVVASAEQTVVTPGPE
jgi:hypothetical protein